MHENEINSNLFLNVEFVFCVNPALSKIVFTWCLVAYILSKRPYIDKILPDYATSFNCSEAVNRLVLSFNLLLLCIFFISISS